MKVLKNLVTPFYRRRVAKASRRTGKARENLGTIGRAREERKRIKALRRDGILK